MKENTGEKIAKELPWFTWLIILHTSIMSASGSLWPSGHSGSDQSSIQTSSLFSILAKKKKKSRHFPKHIPNLQQKAASNKRQLSKLLSQRAVLTWCLLKTLFIYKMPFFGRRWPECRPGGKITKWGKKPQTNKKNPNQTKTPNFIWFILLVNQILGV